MLLEQHKQDEARSLIEKAEQTRRIKMHASLSLLAQSKDHRGLFELAQGQDEAALASFQEALAMRRKAVRHENDWFAISDLHCSEAALRLHRIREAEGYDAGTSRILESIFQNVDHPLQIERLLQESELAKAQGDQVLALNKLAEALSMRECMGGPIAEQSGGNRAY